MSINLSQLIIAISAAILSGMGTAIVANIRDHKKEENRKRERYQDQLKLDLKDLKIELYQVEKDLISWKDKYYDAIQELISVKAELEQAILKISFLESEFDIEHDK